METLFASVDRAFSKQSDHFDEIDKSNPVLSQMREQVYAHVNRFVKPHSTILELNAGTGIDAIHFIREGHQVFATDIASGMIAQIQKKIIRHSLEKELGCRQISFEDLDRLNLEPVDFIFSNFGGLNCAANLRTVTQHFKKILKPGGLVTLVIMPPVCLWEVFSIFKGNVRHAFRRFHRNGVVAHLEGEFFKTYYHSLGEIKRSFGNDFKLIHSEGLAPIGPSPHRGDFPARHPRLYKLLLAIDTYVRHFPPFNRWADHIIVTFQYMSND